MAGKMQTKTINLYILIFMKSFTLIILVVSRIP